MDLGLRTKVAIVTGGASGIGRATVLALAHEGARVVAADRNLEAAKAVAREGSASGLTVVAQETDVTRHEDAEALVRAATERFGGLDVVVTSAGVFLPEPFETHALDKAHLEVDVCLWGTIHVCRAALPALKARGGGRVICISSDAARLGERNMATYAAAKGGILALAKSLAREYGRHRITVNVVCPGTTRTPMTSYLNADLEAKLVKLYPLGRLGEPEDIASAILFLASDRASYITGQVLSVDGGFAMVG